MRVEFESGPARSISVGNTIYTMYEKYPDLPEWFISHKKSLGEEVEPIYQMAYTNDNGKTWNYVE